MRVSDRWAAVLGEAVDRHSMGDVNVDWDCFMQMVPTPGGAAVSMMVTFWMPSVVIGEKITFAATVPEPQNATDDQIDQMVVVSLEQMRQKRSSLLANN